MARPGSRGTEVFTNMAKKAVGDPGVRLTGKMRKRQPWEDLGKPHS